MNLPFLHQSGKNFNLFGLLGNRFLFNKGPHRQPESDVSQTQTEVRETIEDVREAFKARIDDYNNTYGDDVPKEDRDSDLWYKTIKLDPKALTSLKGLKELETRITAISIELKWKHEPEWQKALDEKPKVNAQYNSLQDLLTIIEKMRKLPARGREKVRQARRSRLYRRHERMSQTEEEKKLWAKKPAYREICSVFESMAGNKDFAELFGSPDGMTSQNQREAQELFMAIMAEKTNGFETDFVLGEEFGNNPEENIKRFPFLYNEFLKHEGDAIAGEAVSFDDIRQAETTYTEAFRRLDGETPQQVVQGVQSGGATPAQLDPMPAIPNDEGWKERIRILGQWKFNYRQEAAKDSPQKGSYQKAAVRLEMHLKHAEAGLRLSRLRTREEVVRSQFTRAELSKPTRRGLVITLAMRKFMKAQEIIDHPHGAKSDWRYNLHPTVRRMLVLSVYEGGVAAFENERFSDKPRAEHHWMLSTLAMSDYFNFKEVGDEMDETHQALLKAAFVGGRVAELIERSKDVQALLEDWVAILKVFEDKNITLTDDAREKLFRERMGHHNSKFAAQYAKYSKKQAEDLLGKIGRDQGELNEFLKEVRAAIADPYGEKAQAFIARIKSNAYAGGPDPAIRRLGRWSMVDGASLDAYHRQMAHLEINFRTAELGEMNMLQFFEGLGMNIEGMYPKYLSMIEKNPHLRAEYWERLLMGTDAEFQSLIKLLQVIISDDKTGGKKDFIQGLYSLRRKYKGKQLGEITSKLQEGGEDAVIINVLRMLEEHLSQRGTKAADSARSARDIETRMNGMHIGDRISYYVGGVWDMLTGPGQSPANRVAGLVLMYGMYKAARMAMKGEGAKGKALRALFVAGSIEIAMKEVTGRGVLDRMGLDSVAGAMEGTYEAVLLQDAQENMEDKSISPEAHAAALYELNDIPFDQAMAWYESIDPKKGVRGTKVTGRDKFPKGIDLGRIGKKIGKKFTKEEDRELEAKHVVYQTMKHFFKYVGDRKEGNRGIHHGKEALKERWIKTYDDRKYKPVYSRYDHREWFEAAGVKKADITWQLVMRAEIDPSEVDLTRNKTVVGQLTTTAQEALTDVTEWTKAHVINPGSGMAEELLASAGESAQDIKKFVSEFCEFAERKVYFGKESLILWYGEHQYEIRRVAEDHWNLLVTGVELPFKVVYAVDNWAIPWTVTKIRQIEAGLSSDQLIPTQQNGATDLSATDIASNPAMRGSSNEKLNPEYKYFGIYQEPFMRAFEAKDAPHKEMHYENPETHVGYYIAAATMDDARKFNPKIDPNADLYKGNQGNRHAAMVIAAAEKAKRHFRGLGATDEQLNYMAPVHRVVRTTKPEQVYIFYRMPLEGSMESYLRSSGYLADYAHADRRIDRPMYTVDPSQSSWENLRRAFMLETDATRTFVSGVGGYVAQIPKFVFWNIEGAGDIIKVVGGAFARTPAKKKEFEEAIESVLQRNEAKRVWLDESFTSAKSPNLALSKFYQKKENAKLYNFSLAYAKGRKQPLHLGLLEGEPAVAGEDVSGSMYLEGTIDYQDMLKWYEDNWAPLPDKKDPFIRKKIEDKLKQPAGGAQGGAGGGAGGGQGGGGRP